ncbi:MAG: hypothetical protein NXI22_23495, partial [bacterium]|nr:hypothetical protein [bacterium]
MSNQHFTLRKLLRNPTNRLLERFFSHLQIRLVGIQWSRLPGHAEEQLLAAVQNLPANQRQIVERRLAEIYELCNNAGLQSIFESARHLNVPDLAKK